MGDNNRPNLEADPRAQMELHSTLVPETFRGGWASASSKVSLFGFAVLITAEPKDREYADFGLFLEADLDNSTESTVTELYLRKGRTVKIKLESRGQVDFEIDQLRDAMRFQEKIFSITLGPKTEQDPQHLSFPTLPNWDPGRLYLTLPLLPSTRSPVSVDWKSVRTLLMEVVPGSSPLSQAAREDYTEDESYASDHKSQSKTGTFLQMANGPASLEAVINSLVETTHGNDRKQYIIGSVLGDVNSLSETEKPSQYPTCVGNYKKQDKLDRHSKQLLLNAMPLKKMDNLLVHRTKAAPHKESGSGSNPETFVKLRPELCSLKVLGISSQVVNTVSLIPSFMNRIEKILLATQLQKELEVAFSEAAKVSPETVLQALTTATCQESLSLKRLKFFGDSFLKFAVSKRLFLVHDKEGEGVLTTMRANVISNSYLHQRGVAHKLSMYINDEEFNPLQWSAPGRPCRNRASIHALQLTADASNPNLVKCRRRRLGKKAVARVVEAFIGAHLVDGGPESALAFMEWVGISVSFDNNQIAEASARCAGDTRFAQAKNLFELEQVLGYQFQNKAILVQALTHRSVQVPVGSCYQRLEFLGDAVLDFLITCHIYEKYPDFPPGRLTALRSATVRNECFADIAVRHHLEDFLLYEETALAEPIQNFVLFIQNKEDRGGWDIHKCPKVLADMVESLAGAVLVDTKFDTDKVWAVFEPLLQPVVTPDKLHLNPVSELRELCNKKKFEYDDSATPNGTQTLVKYTVRIGQETIVAEAEKPDTTSAKRQAACEMLGKLKNQGWQHPYRNLIAALQRNEITDEIIAAEASFVKQQDPSTSYTPLGSSHFQPAVWEDRNVDFVDLSSGVQLLIDAHPGLQHGNVGVGVAATKENLNNLCAKYRWTMPEYKPCAGYPQGPPHAPRFAYFVSISCWLMKTGSADDFDLCDIECEGDPMNKKARAMDSAASRAIARLQETFVSGRTPVQTPYFS